MSKFIINPYCPDPGQREKIDLIYKFIITILCGASKGFMKKAFMKPFQAPRRSVKIKI